MAPGHLIWSLRLFVLFFLICKVRCSMETRNCNITATCRMRESFFSRVIYYGPNRDTGYNPCEIPLDCIHPNPGPVKNPCVLCERAIRNHKFICCGDCRLKFPIKCAELQSRNICSWFLATKVGPVNHVIWNLCRNFHFTPHYRTLRRQKI